MFTRKKNITQILEEETINLINDIKYVLNKIYIFDLIILRFVDDFYDLF